MPRLLIVEDQLILLDSMRKGLENEGFEVIIASTSSKARAVCQEGGIDVIVLDVMLPDGSGLELLQELRSSGDSTPVLIVSAQGTVNQRVEGLNVGADDYLAKPFYFSELLARVRALLRRNVNSTETVLRIDDIVIDLVTRAVTRNGVPIDLTPRQFDVLAYLVQHKDQVVSRQMLARDIWRAESATWTNLIEVQINRLRNRLETASGKLRLQTIRGEGYLLGERQS
jgi:two-component system copper resistance phosphate regulon response regulator CusR